MSPKRFFWVFLFIVVTLLLTSHLSYAQGGLFDDVDKLCQTGTCAIEDVIVNITTFVRTLGIALVVVFIIWGSFQLMTSGGEPGKITAGQNTLRWSIIGLGVILLAQGLVYAVLETLKARNIGSSSSGQQEQIAKMLKQQEIPPTNINSPTA